MTAQKIRNISCADTAKLVRAALKAAFPTVKFSVRSKTYSGGASIDIGWTDGPTEHDVMAVAKRFQGATFDGMQDLKTHHTSELNGEQVWFGADYIFGNRSYTLDFLRRRAASVARKYGVEVPTLKLNKWGGVEIEGGWERIGNYAVRDHVMQAAHKTRGVY